MQFSKDKDYLRNGLTARNLFLHTIQTMQRGVESGDIRVWNRLHYVLCRLGETAGVPRKAEKTLEQAIEATKNLFGTYQHSVAGGQKISCIDDESFDDAVRMVLIMLEEME